VKLSTSLSVTVSILISSLPSASALAQDAAAQNSDAASASAQRARTQAALRVRAETEFRDAHPGAVIVKGGRDVRKIYGHSISTGASAADSADNFRRSYARVLGVDATNLVPESRIADKRHTQPVMYDPDTGTYKFTLVHYRQAQNGIPVFRGDLRLLVRNETGFPLVNASSAVKDLEGFSVAVDRRDQLADPAFISARFKLARQAVQSFDETLVNFTEPKAVIWAGAGKIEAAPTLALTFTADNMPSPDGFDQKWTFVTDLATGAIVYKENRILEVDVEGSVSGIVTEGFGAEQCEDEVITPLPYARVNIDATEAFADSNGNYVITNGGSSDVTVDSAIRGEFFEVFTYNGDNSLDGDETTQSQTVTPPGPADFVYNTLNGEFTRGEVNAYYHANLVRDFVLSVNPAYPVIDTQTAFSITVNEGANTFCPGNAQYQGTNLRFCAAGSGFPNTAWSSVIYHEYGHHLVQVAGSGQGQYGEGMGDTVSTLILDVAGTGHGFLGDCGSPLRTGDNTMQYPCSGGIHFCGQLLSGCVWDTRNELLATNPDDYREILSNLTLNSILLHTGSDITPQITVDFLTLDDDDADISNGTPHCTEICAGFGAHNMDCPPFDAVTISYPTGRPATVDADQTTVVPIEISSDNPLPPTGALHYRVGGTGPFTVEPLAVVGSNAFEATLPAADCGEIIEYFVSTSATCGDIQDPQSAPLQTFSALVGVHIEVADNFEADNGWTTVDAAADGQWTRGVPVDCLRGDPPTDFDGSGQCWLTDNSSANGCNSDVDSGTVTLTSPVFNTSTLGVPQVRYARWFSNDAGDGPETDALYVEISTNGGLDWSTLEIVGPTTSDPNPQVSGGWFERVFSIPAAAQFQIRFTAEDVDPQSVVEAGIDKFQIVDAQCAATGCIPGSGDHDGDGDVDATDTAQFINCLLGPNDPSDGSPCDCFDADGNSRIDLIDYAAMQSQFTG